MKRAVLLTVVLAALLSTGAAWAAPPSRSQGATTIASPGSLQGGQVGIDTTITATATSFDCHSGMAACWSISGTGDLPTIGHVQFTGEYDQIAITTAPWGGHTYPSVTIDFTAGNAGTFTIQGDTPIVTDPNHDPMTAQPWTVPAAAGRFAGLTGSGSFSPQWDSAHTALSLALSGTLSLPSTIRVNAAGAAYTDAGGNAWSADCCNSGGNVATTTAAIGGTSDPALYKDERWLAGTFSYTFSGLTTGTYNVTLKFAEIAYLGPGRRQFNVAINGTPVLTNFDVAAQVGFNRALDKTFSTTVGSGGQLTVTFSKGVADNPIVSAIQLVAESPPPPPPPPPAATTATTAATTITPPSSRVTAART